MISLECQQRSGTVIGACRGGVLFGACCHEPDEVVHGSSSQPTEPTYTSSITTTIFAIDETDATKTESTLQSLSDAEYSSTDRNKIKESHNGKDDYTREVDHTLAYSQETPKEDDKEEEAISLDEAVTSVPQIMSNIYVFNPTESPTSLPLSDSTSDQKVSEDIVAPTTVETFPALLVQPSGKAQIQTLAFSSEAVPTFPPGSEVTPGPNVSEKTYLSEERTSTTVPSTPSTTKKFSYGKIKFSPRPFKPRTTTVKAIWTRPPTTEVSYVVFKASEEEEEDEDDGEKYSKLPNSVPTEVISSNDSMVVFSGSVETSTIQRSVEDVPMSTVKSESSIILTSLATQESTTSTTASTNNTSTTTITTIAPEVSTQQKVETHPLDTPVEVMSNSTQVASTLVPIVEISSTEIINQTQANRTTIPIKQSRFENGNELGSDTDDDSQYSSSAGWDNKLDDFVNQVRRKHWIQIRVVLVLHLTTFFFSFH
jgi:hypothetical protein